jgi:hypothetical protein
MRRHGCYLRIYGHSERRKEERLASKMLHWLKEGMRIRIRIRTGRNRRLAYKRKNIKSIMEDGDWENRLLWQLTVANTKRDSVNNKKSPYYNLYDVEIEFNQFSRKQLTTIWYTTEYRSHYNLRVHFMEFSSC